VIEQDSQRAKYLSPEEAVQYGLIDKVLYPEELRREVKDALDNCKHLIESY
jgi:ATP-dependent protease ClpP protease subunit